MHNITKSFTNTYQPFKGIIIYTDQNSNENYFAESFDFNNKGRMINAHPLNMQESRELAGILAQDETEKEQCFNSSGLIPENILYLRAGKDGLVIWHTPAQKKNLFFISDLELANSNYPIPPLLWIADREKLILFALKYNHRPSVNSPLFYAPFFNIHQDGKVCMGTVDIDFWPDCHLEEFINVWEDYFFNSRFSHLLGERSPVKANIIQLYKSLNNAKKQFPLNKLIKTGKKIKNILNEIN